jgi:hypothetical protein
MTDKHRGAISPLRQRMIEDMTIRGFTTDTQRGYICAVRDFATFLGRSPDQGDAEELRRYQLHMRSAGASANGMSPLSLGTSAPRQRTFFGMSGFDRFSSATRVTRTWMEGSADIHTGTAAPHGRQCADFCSQASRDILREAQNFSV